ncbi:type II toxin-antitoxin system PemK/MazF family toxin [Rufibacter sp. LB8]|uniref:type II toxin-antitoxin system PemK/MazF family toxin n=1 Tax=Rufibacter sp. LB8 TaxID=2777781 RepID=UPI00178C2683|nr:type II toxin-antitoxin system PemK/MazF family toxin [Rufibacter sp. LB8]
MKPKQFEVWVADLNPRIGTETGKVRPVVILQTDLLNKTHPSTIICPITINVQPEAEILRVHLPKGTANVKEACDIMIDQIRAIDNSRLVRKIGQLEEELRQKIKENVRIVLDLDV